MLMFVLFLCCCCLHLSCYCNRFIILLSTLLLLLSAAQFLLLIFLLLQNTPNEHPDKEGLTKAVEVMTVAANDVNEFKRRKDLGKTLLTLTMLPS